LDDHETRLRSLEAVVRDNSHRLKELSQWRREASPLLAKLDDEVRDLNRDRASRAQAFTFWEKLLGGVWLGLAPLLTALLVHYLH